VHSLTPKLWTVWKEGYDWAFLRSDAIAGLTVAVVALPLSMALAIASGASPDKGLVTAVIAGFLISALGGSRVQVGGPTGAFVVVVFNVIAAHGYDGLLIATFLAGIILIGAGLLKLGRFIRFIPQPVVIGFTSGIAVIIATSQVKDFLGLHIYELPADFLPKWRTYLEAIGTIEPLSLGLGLASLAVIIILRRLAPRLPGFLIAILLASMMAAIFKLPVETIGSRFPDMPSGLAGPELPDFSIAKIGEVIPSAFTIAFLAGIEALLSAVVADGMAGTRHRSNQELVGQGVANLGSALFGGLPATGAIARTATNIRAGARTPVAGMMHAFFILLFILFAAELMAYVPMATLAAILFMVAWGMSEMSRFVSLLKIRHSDRVVLLTTFFLTVLVDLTVAIGIGVTLASLIFMAKLSETVELEGRAIGKDDSGDELEEIAVRDDLPPDVEVFRIRGPLFFGVASDMLETLRRMGQAPRVIILRMRLVPLLDASGLGMIEGILQQATRSGTRVILSSVQPQPKNIIESAELPKRFEGLEFAATFEAALQSARNETLPRDRVTVEWPPGYKAP